MTSSRVPPLEFVKVVCFLLVGLGVIGVMLSLFFYVFLVLRIMDIGYYAVITSVQFGISVTLIVIGVKKLVSKNLFTFDAEMGNIQQILSNDEENLLNRILTNGGEVSQESLSAATGFSPAKVSRLIQNLRGKRVVIVVKRGKQNVIRLESKIVKVLGKLVIPRAL